MTALIYIIAVLPSIVWLLFYLRKDKHPEPNRMVIKIFLLGVLGTLAALGLQLLHLEILKKLSLQNIIILVIAGMAFIEEYVKYFVVKVGVLKSQEFDEPIDAMLYLIIAALGFAAGENILFLNNLYVIGVPLNEMAAITFGRFISAVFLHTLASGIIGYFLARSLLLKPASPAGRHERKSFVGLGIIIASCLHGIYNYIIMGIGLGNKNSIILLIILLAFMATIVSLAFKNLYKIKSICKI